MTGAILFGSRNVLRISVPWVFEVLEELNRVESIEGDCDPFQGRVTLWAINQKIEALFNESVYRPFLRSSFTSANDLNVKLRELIYVDDTSSPLDENDKVQAIVLVNNFKTIFVAELTSLPIMLVMPKGGYDVSILVERGFELFPPALSAKVPEAIEDANQVGKALAFEMATACGFHAFRVLEATLKRYWDATAKCSRPNLETIGTFANELEKGKYGDTKIWETLRQIAKLHRNPIIHPEVLLSVDEAIATVAISSSAISAMLAHLPDVPLTTSSVGQP